MKMTRWVSAVAVCSTYVLGSGVAGAQQPGFALDRYEPSERGSDWMSVESLDLRGHLRPAAGFVVDGAYRPLAVYAPDGSVKESIVRNQIFAHVGGSLVLWDRLRFGLSLPIAIFEDGHGGTLNGVAYAAPDSSPGIGDLRIGADVRLLGAYGEAFTLAIGARLFLPTGSRTSFTGDEAVRLEGRFMAAGDIGIFTYAARVGVQYRGLSDTFAGSPLGSELLFGGAAGLRLLDKALLVGPEIYGSTIVSDGDAVFKTHATPVEGVIGAHYTFARDFKVGAAIGPGLTRGYGSPESRWLVSFEWAPAYATKPLDRDGDGILDADDACPDVPGVKTNDPKTNGCPPVVADRDHDGVPDADDACPDVPGVKTNDPKTNGCPADRDHDGVPDADDACPDVPGVKTDDPKTNGCPPDPDRDKDGIPNAEDACPDEAGPRNPDPKKNGCPRAFIQAGQIKILDQVKFATASAAIVPGKDSQEVLDAVLKVLQGHAEIKKVRVEGHTDNVGPAAYNRILSKNRAESVMKWLVAHGVPAARLTAEGFGPDKPIDKNDSEAGRRNNRRVEFHIVEEPTPSP